MFWVSGSTTSELCLLRSPRQDICSRHHLRVIDLLNLSPTTQITRALERTIAANTTAGGVVRYLHLGDATRADSENPDLRSPPLELLQTVIRYSLQLTVVTCSHMSMEIFLLLVSVCGHSLLRLIITLDNEEDCQSRATVAYLPSLRLLRVRPFHCLKPTASDGVVIHAPSLLDLHLQEGLIGVATLLPSLFYGRYVPFNHSHSFTSHNLVSVRLPQLRRLTVSSQRVALLDFDRYSALIVSHGARITECTVPMALVALVTAHCPAIEKITIAAFHPSTLVSSK